MLAGRNRIEETSRRINKRLSLAHCKLSGYDKKTIGPESEKMEIYRNYGYTTPYNRDL